MPFTSDFVARLLFSITINLQLIRNMSKIKFKYDFLVFLFFYLEQASLSLHRINGKCWKDLQQYYEDKINPSLVINYILCNSGIDIKKLNIKELYTINVPKKSFFSGIKSFIFGFFKKKPFLTEYEICYCCQKLQIFANMLQNNSSIDSLEIQTLRIDISKFIWNILQDKIYLRDRAKNMPIEHYYQSESDITTKIKDLVKNFEL